MSDKRTISEAEYIRRQPPNAQIIEQRRNQSSTEWERDSTRHHGTVLTGENAGWVERGGKFVPVADVTKEKP